MSGFVTTVVATGADALSKSAAEGINPTVSAAMRQSARDFEMYFSCLDFSSFSLFNF